MKTKIEYWADVKFFDGTEKGVINCDYYNCKNLTNLFEIFPNIAFAKLYKLENNKKTLIESARNFKKSNNYYPVFREYLI